MIIYRGEETIHKGDKKPSDIERYSNRKEDDTARHITLLDKHISRKMTSNDISNAKTRACACMLDVRLYCWRFNLSICNEMCTFESQKHANQINYHPEINFLEAQLRITLENACMRRNK